MITTSITVSSFIILYVLFAHWIADFHCQTHNMATKKSISNGWLSLHVGVYTLGMAIAIAPLCPSLYAFFGWVAFNGVAHWITDYFTSRRSSFWFKQNNYHNGFVVVGFDQWIHNVCLILSTSVMLG